MEIAADLVDVPAVGGGDHHVVRYLADDVELLDRHLQKHRRKKDPTRERRKFTPRTEQNRTEQNRAEPKAFGWGNIL